MTNTTYSLIVDNSTLDFDIDIDTTLFDSSLFGGFDFYEY